VENTQLEINELRDIMLGHLGDLHRFYGEQAGVRVARKHLTWYCECLENAEEYRHQVVRVNSASEQIRLTKQYFLGIEQSGTTEKQQRPYVQDQQETAL
jgi:tRNA-dihydrouridine synthase